MGKEKQAPAATSKKKAKRSVSVGIAYIEATFNNTTVTITDTKGRHALLGQRRHERLQGQP